MQNPFVANQQLLTIAGTLNEKTSYLTLIQTFASANCTGLTLGSLSINFTHLLADYKLSYFLLLLDFYKNTTPTISTPTAYHLTTYPYINSLRNGLVEVTTFTLGVINPKVSSFFGQQSYIIHKLTGTKVKAVTTLPSTVNTRAENSQHL